MSLKIESLILDPESVENQQPGDYVIWQRKTGSVVGIIANPYPERITNIKGVVVVIIDNTNSDMVARTYNYDKSRWKKFKGSILITQ